MCGITGIYSYKRKIDPELVRVMTDILKHRGPDDEGYLAINSKTNEIYQLIGNGSKVGGGRIEEFKIPTNLLIGHRRLSILDLSPFGHQPMGNKDKTIWITYNGEIYNYLELREELKSLGHNFHTNTDTEVLVAAYEEWGESCLDKFNGMWAFVIYDKRKNILFGARDRFGVKPLYYYLDEDYFAFASEVKALLGLDIVRTEINSQAVFDYLVFGWLENQEEGFFKSIFELQPSQAFRYDLTANTFKKWGYYDLKYKDGCRKFDKHEFKKYAEKTKQLILDSISLRLRSDVPIGTCLSGGIDSSAIVCFINKILERGKVDQIGVAQKVFTAVYDDESLDESKWAKIVVEKTKTSWYYTTPKPLELLEDLEDLVYLQDIPFGSTSIFAQYKVMKLAKNNGVKVLLDGQGGDELFTGYMGSYRAFFINILKNYHLRQFIKELNNINNSPVDKTFLFSSSLKLFFKRLSPMFLKTIAYRLVQREVKYFQPHFWNAYKDRLDKDKTVGIGSLNKALHENITGPDFKTLLRYEDRNSMRFSIEARTPFADDINLIEYVFQIPEVYKIHNGWSKYLLRWATNGVIPDEIRLRRDKLGFSTPEVFWLQKNKVALYDYMTADLNDYLNIGLIKKNWGLLFKAPYINRPNNIWRLINFAVWVKVFSDHHKTHSVLK